MNFKFVIFLISVCTILTSVIVDHEAIALVTSSVTVPQPVVQDDPAGPSSLMSLTTGNSFLQSCGTTLPGEYPTYGPAVKLMEELSDGSVVEMVPAYSPNGSFGMFSMLEENDTQYMWVSNIQTDGTNFNSREQRLESQDGLVWRNRASTNLAISNGWYNYLPGLRQVIKSDTIYEGWEVYYYNVINGWWAVTTRYVTSTDGLTWTVANQPIIATLNSPNIIKVGGVYHLWGNPDVDSRYDPDKAVRYRTSNLGGSNWGHWKTGGTIINIDGSPLASIRYRVRQLADGTYQLFYYTGNNISLATSSNGITFTNQITDLLDVTKVLSATSVNEIGDFGVSDVDGEDWFYFSYTNADGGYLWVSRPIPECNLQLLPILNKDSGGLTFPIFIGSAIPARPVNPQGETFYSRLVSIPDQLPLGGRFYFSSRPNKVAEIYVDDRLVVSLPGGVELFYYHSVLGQSNIVEVPRSVMSQMAGETVLVEYRDIYGAIISATDVWLIWVP